MDVVSGTHKLASLLPSVCDGQNAAWRLAMVHAVSDLAEDLRASRRRYPGATPRKSPCT